MESANILLTRESYLMTNSRIKVVFSPETLAQIERDYPADEVQSIIDQLTAAALSYTESSGTELDSLAEEDPELLLAMEAEMRLRGFETMDEWFNAETTKPVLN